MAAVHSFGKGYFVFDTEGVTVSPEVETRVNTAFQNAMAIPDDQIKVRLAREQSLSQPTVYISDLKAV